MAEEVATSHCQHGCLDSQTALLGNWPCLMRLQLLHLAHLYVGLLVEAMAPFVLPGCRERHLASLGSLLLPMRHLELFGVARSRGFHGVSAVTPGGRTAARLEDRRPPEAAPPGERPRPGTAQG